MANLAITVGFRRRMSRQTAALYTEMVADWLASVEQAGMFGEGPILPIEPGEVKFQNPRAQFRVDARRSGQNTLNWFTLKALQFGIDVAAIHTILFDTEENLDRRLPVSTPKTTRLPIP